MNFDPTKAYITDSNNNIYQVLLHDGSDWDEAATKALYDAAMAQQNQAA